MFDESTSPQRQREIIEQWASVNDHEITGWAEDLDVSGSVDPFDAPALGPWLTDRRKHEWDILCAWKLDRISRRAIPMNKVFGWMIENEKTLVCVSDNLDLSTWVGRMIANVIAGVAEGELEAISERTLASHRKLRELGRWPGGKPAYGYRAQQREDAAGWELVPDEHASQVLAGIVDGVLAGESVESIARALTDAGELSPSDYIRVRNGEEPRGHPWNGQAIRRRLRSRTLLGHITHDGASVFDAEGAPVRKGPPLIPQERFDQLQQALRETGFVKTNNRTSRASPLLGVAVCEDCGTGLYHRGQTTAGKLYRYYYCPEKHGAALAADDLESLVSDLFHEHLGESLVQERVFIPGESHQAELDEAVRATDEITLLLGTIASATMRSRLTGQLQALDTKIAELENKPARSAAWEYRQSEKTYAQEWAEADAEERRQLLLRSGITVAALRVPKTQVLHTHLRVPHDIEERLTN
jgi:DNA invertase Pin-like site-specific DNA recombinase